MKSPLWWFVVAYAFRQRYWNGCGVALYTCLSLPFLSNQKVTEHSPLTVSPLSQARMFIELDAKLTSRHITLPKEPIKTPTTRSLGVNSIVTGFGNEFKALGSNDVKVCYEGIDAEKRQQSLSL
ncbi:unnamed protein product [Lactuca virosa]|uniref:Uncharacterized protein n=1 Tax=Lactuca virosa TaxID=75947 RepID=A0AAU9PFH7_9ASTR|nr:unnamed protein product [Lactuca virosa]